MRTYLLHVADKQLSPSHAAHTAEKLIGDDYDPVARSLIKKLELLVDAARAKQPISLPELSPSEALLLYLWAKLGAGAINAPELEFDFSSPTPEENSSR